MSERAELEDVVRQAGRQDGGVLDIGRIALALAGIDRPRVGLKRYHDHLAQLTSELAPVATTAASPADAAAGLAEVIANRHGYRGDDRTYDDQQNANLMRVIDRRKGLPVALSILYLHAGRGVGWQMAGLNFPAHFLLRLELNGERAIIDPFGEGRVLAPPDLRDLLKRLGGATAELDNAYFQPVSDRDVLLRLQNNIKTRALQARDLTRATDVTKRMLLLAPERAPLYRDLGLIEAHGGNLSAAIAAIETYAERADSEAQRHDAATLLQQLKAKLN